MNARYDEEARRFLRDHIPGRSCAETVALFNAWNSCCPEAGEREFPEPLTAAQVRRFAARYGIRTGRDTRFKPGRVPHNKARPVGSTRVTVDGCTEIKVAEPRKWRMLHVVIWERAHGPVPGGHVVIFGDGNRQNLALDNLLLVSRAELAVLNRFKLYGSHAELTKTGTLVANLIMKTRRREFQ